jgi:hypothetical protein
VQWDGQETCSECHSELLKKGVSPLKLLGNIPKLPCKKHGHPGMLSSRLRAWWDFFAAVRPYSTAQTNLDHNLISKICDAYEIDFIDAFEMLTKILNVVLEHGDKGTGKSS